MYKLLYYLTCATVQNLTMNLCIFINLEGIFFTPFLHNFTYWFCHSHRAFLITRTTSIKELLTQDTVIYHLQTWEDRVGRRLLSLPLCLLYFILFKICGFSFLQTASDMAKRCVSSVKCSCLHHFKEVCLHT